MLTALYFFGHMLILVGMYLCTVYIWGKLQKRPPSPFLCFPLIGHVVDKHPIAEAYAELANRYGPVYFLWSGSRPTVVVSSPKAAEECLCDNDVVFCNRIKGTLVGKYRGYDYTSLNFAPYGPHWRNLRKIATVEILSSRRLLSLAAIRAHELRLLIKRLSGSSRVVEMRPQILDTTLNIMTRMIFGEAYYGLEACSEKARRLREMVVESIAVANMPCVGDFVPCLRWLDRSAEKRFKEYTEKRDRIMTELFEEHRDKRIHPNPDPMGKPMIQSLLELQESDPEYYKDQVLHSLVLDLLIGSTETTISTIEWALSLLLNHPEVLKKVRTEIDKHVGYSRLLEEPDLNQLPYLRCVINETLRMYPPLPFLFPHESSKDCVVGGYHVRNGTFLIINIHAMQNDPKNWESPRSFRPERFEGVEGHKIGYKMMPFGSGRRSCPGEGLAVRVMGMMLGTLIQCLDIERVDDKLVNMAQLESFNIQMGEPLTARIQSRHIMINLLQNLGE
ncbi:cytochrome P450 81Q32-like [Silene latifolia]|uniref:cytochrome P450 81Q32-like n=1 Tax=Silene latifolia TaxID=37657 RepID=UPI003D77D4A9